MSPPPAVQNACGPPDGEPWGRVEATSPPVLWRSVPYPTRTLGSLGGVKSPRRTDMTDATFPGTGEAHQVEEV